MGIVCADGDGSGIGSSIVLPREGQEKGRGHDSGAALAGLRSLAAGRRVQVKIHENQWASLVCGRSRTRIAGMSRESFPELPAMPAVLAEIPIGVLAWMIAKTIFAISSEESRFTLNGALLVLKKGSMAMVATDGHRLAMVESSEDLPGVTGAYRALLPRKAMAEMQKLAADAAPDRAAFLRRRESSVFRAGRAAAAQPQAHRKFSGF